MPRTMPLLIVPCLAALVACGRPAPDTNSADVAGSAGSVDRNVESPAPSPAATPTATADPTIAATDLAGRWTGVEGMYLVVTPKAPGAYTLEMQYDLDHKVTVAGRTAGQGIVFECDGKTLTLKPGDGASTGLKYLDGKRDCLTVAPGEGYCRD